MDPRRPYNHYDSNLQSSSSMSGPHGMGPPGYSQFPVHGSSPGGHHTSHGDTGPYYPSPGYPGFSAPPHGGPMLPRPPSSLPMPHYRQKVTVRITADTWVIGVIVGIAHFCSKFTGRKYRVEFESIDGTGRRETRDFSHEEMMPYRRGK
ncbi:hypothetical protein BJV77DRAFT_990240 [Russula vinacea]|nr:hypothetical protein BJV77DRAFT_990240 [Russula vinacea]